MTDNTEIQKVIDRMKSATKKLHDLIIPVGNARQIKEFNSDQRKMALAQEIVKSLKAGESAAAADAIARASETYRVKMDQLAKEYAEAERTLAEWAACQCSYECARSLLSLHKESLHHLQG